MLPPNVRQIPRTECGTEETHEEHLWVSTWEFMGKEEYQAYICSGEGE